MTKIVSVAVIGAGAAGLCALRHLAMCTVGSLKFRAKAFEQSTHVGGSWLYTDHVGIDGLGLPVHSSMYKNLKTNVPKECMHFPDFAFPAHLPSYITHKDVQTYLEDYATHFDLRKYIQFKTIVEMVKPVHGVNNKFSVMWEVTTANVIRRKEKRTELFDAVLVCNGKYSFPKMPVIQGLETFDGHVIHCHDYRVPDDYLNKNVVVVGASSSGQDISLELSDVSRKVYLCYNESPITTVLPPNVELKPRIKQCHGRVIEFVDESTCKADAMILCTGYMHDFSFLDGSIGLKVNDGRVTPLFKHFLPIGFPTLGIVGVLRSTVFFPLFHVQIKYFRSILCGIGTLPSEKEMQLDEEEDYNERRREGKPHRYAHFLSDKQFDYFDSLADLGCFQRLSSIYKKVYLACVSHRKVDVTTYRDYEFIVDDNDTLINISKPLKSNDNDDSIFIKS